MAAETARLLDPALYVPQAAAALGLPLAPGDLPGVIAAFAVLARVAGPVMATELPADLMAAAVFTPGDAMTGGAASGPAFSKRCQRLMTATSK